MILGCIVGNLWDKAPEHVKEAWIQILLQGLGDGVSEMCVAHACIAFSQCPDVETFAVTCGLATTTVHLAVTRGRIVFDACIVLLESMKDVIEDWDNVVQTLLAHPDCTEGAVCSLGGLLPWLVQTGRVAAADPLRTAMQVLLDTGCTQEHRCRINGILYRVPVGDEEDGTSAMVV
jgi:hypothetical protein